MSRRQMLRPSSLVVSSAITTLLLAACGSAPDTDGEWASGAFLATNSNATGVTDFSEWRGRPLDGVLVYPTFGSWEQIVGSDYILTQFGELDAFLVYGLPLLPTDGSTSLDDVAAGAADRYFLQIADELAATGHEDAIVRVGFEANGTWFPWGATVDTATAFRAAARRAMTVMKDRIPTLRMGFDISCGGGLEGSDDRLAALTELYPGDDVTDLIGCDNYDFYVLQASTDEEWAAAIRPENSPGLADVADFARARGKGLVVPEWGLHWHSTGGRDNPEFIRLMHQYFEDNDDILVFEAYFDEPDREISSALWGGPRGSRNPASAETYKDLWRN